MIEKEVLFYRCSHCEDIVPVGKYQEHAIFHNKTSTIQMPETFKEYVERFTAVGLLCDADLIAEVA